MRSPNPAYLINCSCPLLGSRPTAPEAGTLLPQGPCPYCSLRLECSSQISLGLISSPPSDVLTHHLLGKFSLFMPLQSTSPTPSVLCPHSVLLLSLTTIGKSVCLASFLLLPSPPLPALNRKLGDLFFSLDPARLTQWQHTAINTY